MRQPSTHNYNMLEKILFLFKGEERLEKLFFSFIAMSTLIVNFSLQCSTESKVEHILAKRPKALNTESAAKLIDERSQYQTQPEEADSKATYEEHTVVDQGEPHKVRVKGLKLNDKALQSINISPGDTLAGMLRSMQFSDKDAHLVSVSVSKVYPLSRIRPGKEIVISSEEGLIKYIAIDVVEIKIDKRGQGYVAKLMRGQNSDPSRFMPIFTLKKNNMMSISTNAKMIKNVELQHLKKTKDAAYSNKLQSSYLAGAKVVKVKANSQHIGKGIPKEVTKEVVKIMEYVRKKALLSGDASNVTEMTILYLPKKEIGIFDNVPSSKIEKASYKPAQKRIAEAGGELLHASFKFADIKGIAVYKHKFNGSEYFYNDGTPLIDKHMIFKMPVKNPRITSKYGMRLHPIHKKRKMHNGIDYASPRDSGIFSAADGIVTKMQSDRGGFGNYVKVKHFSGHTTLYAHMSSFAEGLYLGKNVRQGELIGRVGKTGAATGYHLHFEIHENGLKVDPLLYVQGKPQRLNGFHLSIFNENKNIINSILNPVAKNAI